MGFLSALIIALLALQPAHAAPADNGSSDIMSLNFYAHRHVWYVNPNFFATLRDESKYDDFTDVHITSNQIFFGVAYGLFTDFRVVLQETFLWDQTTQSATNPATGEQTASTTAGPSNPTVILAWRWLESSAAGLSGDLNLNVTPNVGPHILANADTGTVGTNYAGGASVAGVASLYWRWGFNELGTQYIQTRTFSMDSQGTTAAASSTTAPSWITSVNLRDRIHLGPRYFLGVNLLRHLAHDYTSTFGNGIVRQIHVYAFTDPSVELGFRPEPYYVLALVVGANHSSTTVTASNGNVSNAGNDALTAQINFSHQFW
jgi:hypothetical protein